MSVGAEHCVHSTLAAIGSPMLDVHNVVESVAVGAVSISIPGLPLFLPLSPVVPLLTGQLCGVLGITR